MRLCPSSGAGPGLARDWTCRPSRAPEVRLEPLDIHGPVPRGVRGQAKQNLALHLGETAQLPVSDQSVEADRQGHQLLGAGQIPSLGASIFLAEMVVALPPVLGFETEGDLQPTQSGYIRCSILHSDTSLPQIRASLRRALTPGERKVTVTLPPRPSYPTRSMRSRTIRASPAPPECDTAVTQNGLRLLRAFPLSYDPLSPDSLVRLSADTYRRGVLNVEAGARMQPGC